MEQFQIETAQNISIDQQTAHLGERMLGYIIDVLVLVLYVTVTTWLLAIINVDFNSNIALLTLLFLPVFLYSLLFELFMDGKTIGKYVMKTKVVKIDGSKAALSHYFIRWILRLVDITLTSGGVAVFTLLIRGQGQRLGDIAAGTTVISEKAPILKAARLLKELPDDYKPQYAQVTIFKDAEMNTIRKMYYSAKGRGDHKVIVALSDRIKKVTGISTERTATDFVATVIQDYTYYTQDL